MQRSVYIDETPDDRFPPANQLDTLHGADLAKCAVNIISGGVPRASPPRHVPVSKSRPGWDFARAVPESWAARTRALSSPVKLQLHPHTQRSQHAKQQVRGHPIEVAVQDRGHSRTRSPCQPRKLRVSHRRPANLEGNLFSQFELNLHRRSVGIVTTTLRHAREHAVSLRAGGCVLRYAGPPRELVPHYGPVGLLGFAAP